MKIFALNIIIPALCFLGLGLLFIGGIILERSNTLFTFTIYGIAAVLFYNLIIQFDIRAFILIGLLFALLALIIFKPTTNIMVNVRNINWFILIGVMVFIISQNEKRGYYKNSNGRIIISWLIGFICVYLTMALLNIYVYQFYQLDERFGLFFYLRQAIKLGSVLGVGLGLGSILTQSFKNNKVKIIKTV